MKKLTTILLLLCLITGCQQETNKPVNVEYFKVGDILYHDYAVPDTLIVIDAVSLNKDMALIEQGIIDATDGEIAAIFYRHCELHTK